MKKLIVGLFAILALASCGKSNDTSGNAAPSIVGNWIDTNFKGSAVAEKDADILILKADNTFRITDAKGNDYYPANSGGRYAVNGANLVLTYSDNSVVTRSFQLTATNLTTTRTDTTPATVIIYQRLSDQELQQVNARNNTP